MVEPLRHSGQIDAERERISLGIKQLEKDPFSGWLAAHPKNSIVKGTVTEVDARGAVIDLGDGVYGSLRASELGRERVEDARTMIKVGEEIEAKSTNVDRKTRTIALSIKAKEVHEEQEAVGEKEPAIDALGVTPAKVVMQNGGEEDNNAFLFRDGYNETVEARVADGSWELVADQFTPGWDNAEALSIAEQIQNAEGVHTPIDPVNG